MLDAAKKAGQITKDHHPDRADVGGDDIGKTTLSDVGISRDLSSRAQSWRMFRSATNNG
jgi:hypothetical protein